MKALLFPGQGSQVVGMGSEFYINFDLVKKIFKEADEKLNFAISKLILEGPTEELTLTKNTQPAILTVSYSIFKVMKEEFGLNLKNFKYFAGHSLGEYSALVSSNSLTFLDALHLLHERGKAMQNAVPVGQGSMLAILGLKINEINELIKNQKGVCEVANDNAEGQVIVSGDKSSIGIVTEKLKEKKVKCIPLNVSAPFHCSLMKSAAESMKEKIEKTVFKNPDFTIINNVTAEEIRDASEIKKLLVDQIFSTVKWRESILKMYKEGIESFIEVGPGKALIGMTKRTIKEKKVNCFSINSITDIKNLLNEFK